MRLPWFGKATGNEDVKPAEEREPYWAVTEYRDPLPTDYPVDRDVRLDFLSPERAAYWRQRCTRTGTPRAHNTAAYVVNTEIDAALHDKLGRVYDKLERVIGMLDKIADKLAERPRVVKPAPPPEKPPPNKPLKATGFRGKKTRRFTGV